MDTKNVQPNYNCDKGKTVYILNFDHKNKEYHGNIHVITIIAYIID